jgi:hypothetical protein
MFPCMLSTRKANKIREPILGHVVFFNSRPIDVIFEQCVRASLYKKGNKTREPILGHVLLLTCHPVEVTFEQCVRAFFVQKGGQTAGIYFRSRAVFKFTPNR